MSKPKNRITKFKSVQQKVDTFFTMKNSNSYELFTHYYKHLSSEELTKIWEIYISSSKEDLNNIWETYD